MSNRIIADIHLSEQQVKLLAELFAVLFTHYRTHSTPSTNDFIRQLRTLAGLGLTASVVEGFLSPYQHYFNEFTTAQCGEFRGDPGADALWGNRIANLVALGLDSFRRISYPPYYADFAAAIESCLKSLPMDLAGLGDDAEAVLTLLPQPKARLY
jgi:hypothetical protein